MLRPNFAVYHPSLTASPQSAKNRGNDISIYYIKNPDIDQKIVEQSYISVTAAQKKRDRGVRRDS